MYPEDLRYTKDHEWVRIEGDRARVGITDHAQDQLGDVVFLDFPEVGRQLNAHDQFGTVESVKAVSELFSPLAGEVTAVNEALGKTPELVNSDPYGAAWLIELRIDPAAGAALMDAAAYQAWIQAEGK
jgi:glycine cleavage system H protein